MDTNTLLTLVELLRQPKPVTVSETLSEEKDPKEKPSPTLLEIREQDRYRVLQLIEELVDAQDEADTLKQKLNDERREFREKRSTFIKKLDLSSEKNEKLTAEIQFLKEKHSHSLSALEKKISSVSQKFEESTTKLQELRVVNAELSEENMMLRSLNNEATQRIAAMQAEYSQRELLSRDKHNRRNLRKQMKKLPPERMASMEIQRKESTVTVPHSLSKTGKSEANQCSNYSSSCSGAGDFVTNNSSYLGVNTIKPPVASGFEDDVQSSFALSNSSKQPFSVQTSSNQVNNKIELADITILENLFFRF